MPSEEDGDVNSHTRECRVAVCACGGPEPLAFAVRAGGDFRAL